MTTIALAFTASPFTAFAQNTDCALIVPNEPLTAVGLATPYKLAPTDPTAGPCHETNQDQSAFVQAAILDPATGQISIYNPLVIDEGTEPAAPPVVPQLPRSAVVALWFGYNGSLLTLLGAAPDVLSANGCHQGFGQFAYCGAPVFFAAAGLRIYDHKLQVPPLSTGKDNRPCPSVRSFAVVDQDQSDNLTTTYLIAPNGRLAQNTAANLARFPTATTLGNPSDNRLTDVFLDPALGCTPWTAPDLADPGHQVPALPLNELQAAVYQASPIAQIPLGDPMVLDSVTGHPKLSKVNEYRLGVGQFPAFSADGASTTSYCANLRAIATEKLILDRPFFTAFRSPFPDMANSLFTFMAQRFTGTYQILNCQKLLGRPDPITLVTNTQGIVIDAMIQP